MTVSPLYLRRPGIVSVGRGSLLGQKVIAARLMYLLLLRSGVLPALQWPCPICSAAVRWGISTFDPQERALEHERAARATSDTLSPAADIDRKQQAGEEPPDLAVEDDTLSVLGHEAAHPTLGIWAFLSPASAMRYTVSPKTFRNPEGSPLWHSLPQLKSSSPP